MARSMNIGKSVLTWIRLRESALVPVVATPGLALHVLEVNARPRAGPCAPVSGPGRPRWPLRNTVSSLCRTESRAPGEIAHSAPPAGPSREAAVQLGSSARNSPASGAAHGVVQRLRLLIERELLALEHPGPGRHGTVLPAQIAVAQSDQTVAIGRNAVSQDRDEGIRRRSHLGDAQRSAPGPSPDQSGP